MKKMCRLFPIMTLLLVAAVRGYAQDSDRDGIPDSMEEELGTNPNFAEELALVYDDKSLKDGDTSVSKDHYFPSHDITKVYFGDVAGNRFIWRIEFLEPIDVEQLGLILYLDADNNETTGRKDAPGVDFMFTRTGTTVFTPDGKSSSDAGTRVAIDGSRLYFVRDVDLNQEGGQSVFRMWLLCETRTPHKFVDRTPPITVKGPGVSDRMKMPTIADITENQNVEALYGLAEIARIKADKDNIVIRIGDCDMDGYMYDIFSEYKESSARVTRANGAVSFVVPSAGRYYPAFLAYDDFGDEKYAVSVDGMRKGIAIATCDNRRTWLYWLAEAMDFKGGERIAITAVGESGVHRLEDILLLKEKPTRRDREFTFSEVRAQPIFDEKGVSARVTWITSWSCGSVVEYGLDAKYGKTADIDEPAGRNAVCNHRVYLRGLEEDRTYQFRVLGTDPKDNMIRSKDFTFSTERPKPFVGSVKKERVPLTLKNDLDVSYVSWPVTSGVPFPKGALGSAENIRVLDPRGDETPLQTRVTARWPDGSVKWVLLDFQADVPANSETTYVLEYGTDVAAIRETDSPLKVEDGEDAVTIVTGPMKLILNKKRFDFFGKAWLDENGDGAFDDSELVLQGGDSSGIFLTGDDGTVYSSQSAPDEVIVEERGPRRAVVKISGVHKAGEKELFAYIVRIHAYAGKPYLRVFHTWGNNRTEEDFTNITSIYLKTPLAGGVQSWTIGGEKEPITGSPDAGEVRLFQNFDDKYSVAVGNTARGSGDRAAGWADVTNGKIGVATAVRYFWELYPKDFIADKDGIRVGICPALGKDDYAAFPFEKEQHYLYYYLLNGRYKLKLGVTKRHELLYYFHKGDAKAGEAERHAKCFARPLVAVAPPAWYCDSKAFYDVAPKDAEKFGLYETSVENSLSAYLQRREKVKEYGMLNFGDWYGERQVNWGNIEYDTQHGMCLQFIRSGDLGFFYTGEQAQQHNMDVDTVHYEKNPDKIGAVYAHCQGHVGSYYKIPAAPPGTPVGGFTVSHTWCEGHLDYYFFTGDQPAFDAAKRITDRYDWQYTKEYDFGNGRTAGWHLILTMAMYNATYDPYYLNAAKIIVDRVMERERPGGGWRRQLVPGHCYDIPRHHGNAMFMVGILLDGLKYYHAASAWFTQDKEVADMIVRGAEYIIGETWEPAPEHLCFRYTSCPNSSKGHGATLAQLQGIAYAYRLSGKELFKDVVMAGGAAGIGAGAYGKGFSSAYRSAPRTLYDVDLWGGKFLPPPPPTFVEPNWYKGAVVIQAEDFSRQGGGEVQVRDDRAITVGKMITYWHQNIGHWLEWRFTLPAAGKYALIIRYATGSKNTQRDLQIDGAYPHKACKQIRFKETGGFGTAPEQWQYLTVSDDQNQPVLLDLSAGEHTIRMSNLGDGLAVDFLALMPQK